MCYTNCPHQNYDGECRHSINGLHPCDEGYEEAASYQDYLRDEADEQRYEFMREICEEEAHHGN